MSKSRSRLAAAMLATSLLAGVHGLAQAHSHAIEQTPAPGSTVSNTPASVAIVFDGRVELPFSTITVTGPDGQSLETGKLSYASDDRKSLTLPLPTTLAPGRYQVEWNVTSADSHKVSGQYDFTLQP